MVGLVDGLDLVVQAGNERQHIKGKTEDEDVEHPKLNLEEQPVIVPRIGLLLLAHVILY